MKCKKCGAEIKAGSSFCSACGEKQIQTYTQVFERKGMSSKKFIKSINEWFWSNPKVANVNCRFELDSGIGLLANKYRLDKVTLEYELFENSNTYRYTLAKEDSYHFAKIKAKKFIEKWQKRHTEAKIVNWESGSWTRGSIISHLLGGIGGITRLNVYFLYKERVE